MRETRQRTGRLTNGRPLIMASETHLTCYQHGAAPPPDENKQCSSNPSPLIRVIMSPETARTDISMTMQHAKVGKGKLRLCVLRDDNR